MKNLAKFFVAVAALFVGVSCTTDTTEDLGQQIVGKGQTVLTVSTGESVLDTKTSLGGKVDGTYPIYWSNGDKLSLNGVASAPLADVEANSTTASFTWEGTFDAPFCVAYPASAEGTVTFAAEQSYVEGTFSQNAVPMIGYADEAGVSGVQLQYLAGVLQFNIAEVVGTGETANLASVIIETVDGTPIAGVFDCDFATGTVKPQAGSRSSIDYSFGEEGMSVEVGASFHVAVPAGVYEAVKVIFIEQDGAAYEATLKAPDSKPIGVGEVREFSVKYDANTTYAVIKDADTLAQFAESATDIAQAIVLKDIEVGADFAWTPINGFTGLLRGNGKTIKGLTKPLCDTLKGTITNLTLNSAVVSGNTTDGSMNRMGLFAKTMAPIEVAEGQTAPTPTLINCVAKGSLTVNNTTEPHVTTGSLYCFGGLVGKSINSKIKGCSNEAVVTSSQIAKNTSKADKAVKSYSYLGGVVGLANSTVVTECVNKALVDWNDITCNKYTHSPMVGGVAGYVNTSSTFSDNKNFGEIKVQRSIRTGAVGGVAGQTVVNMTNCENHGAINVPIGNAEHRYTRGWGGVVGAAYKNNITLTNCDNYGAINFAAGFTVMRLGGVLGSTQSDDPNASLTKAATQYTVNLSDCDNYGPITISGEKKTAGSAAEPTGVRYGIFFVGGIASYTTGTISNVHNHKSATITINGGGILDYGVNRGTDPIESVPQNCWGGILGRKTTTGGTMYNDADIIIGGTWTVRSIPTQWGTTEDETQEDGIKKDEDGNIIYTYTTDPAKHTADVFIGGIYGNGTCSMGASINNGNITINNTASFDCGLWIGGMAARCPSTQDQGLTNNGKITYSGVKCTNLRLGGIAGISGAITSATNNGDIKIDGTFEFPTDGNYTFNVGGLIGYAGGTINTSTNNGNINISSPLVIPSTSTYGNFGIAGIAARGVVVYNTVTNTGDITVSSNIAAVPQTDGKNNYSMHPVYIAGVAGWAGAKNVTKAYNSGKITVSGTHSYTSGALHISGVYGRGSQKASFTYSNCENTGAIEVSTIMENSGPTVNIAGVSSFLSQETIKDCFNNAPIKFTGKCPVLNIGGVFTGTASNTTVFDNCDNKENGTITVNGEIFHNEDYSYVGGIMHKNANNITLTDCENLAKIEYTNTSTVNNGAYACVGGILGQVTVKPEITNCINEGEITLHTAVQYLGGCFGYVDVTEDYDISAWTNIKNTGTITYPKLVPGKISNIGGVAGCIVNAVGSIKQWHNEGDINVATDANAVINKRLFIGGIVGESHVTKFSYCSNTGDVLAPYSRRTTASTPDLTSWVGLLTGTRYYHTGAEGGWDPARLYYADNCLIKGTIKRYKTNKSGVDECVVDTVEEVHKYAFADPASMEGEQAPTLYMTNISVTTMPEEPKQD